MAWILCYLIKHPSVAATLLQELEPVFGKTTPGEFSDADLRGLPFLQAVIDETLRLQPPAGNGSARMTPPEGIEIAGTHIPGQVGVWVPVRAQQRDERFFAQPDDFIPERWTTRPELVLDRRVYAPFNTGEFSGEESLFENLFVAFSSFALFAKTTGWSMAEHVLNHSRVFPSKQVDGVVSGSSCLL